MAQYKKQRRKPQPNPPALQTGVAANEPSLQAEEEEKVEPKKSAPQMPSGLRSELADILKEEAKHPSPGSVAGRDQKFDGKRMVVNGMSIVGDDPSQDKRLLPHKNVGKRLVPLIEKPEVLVADIATKEGKAEYEKALALIANSNGTYVPIDKEVGPRIILDPQCERGFRAIIILRYAKVTKIVAVAQQAYEEVTEEELKKKFSSFIPMEYIDETPDPLLTEQSPLE